MKYKWRITLIFKNGEQLKGTYTTKCENSVGVAKELFPDGMVAGIGGIITEDEKETLFFRQEEVQAFKIGIFEEKESKE